MNPPQAASSVAFGRRLARAAVVLLAASILACLPSGDDGVSPSASGPMVIITLSALPASLVGSVGGEPGWTPRLDQLAEEAWSSRAVATSSSPVPSLASILTGVDPWQHQVLSHRAENLRADVATVAATLSEAGWSTSAFYPPSSRFERYGLLDGFHDVHDLGDGRAAEETLRIARGRRLIWIHLPDPGFPFIDRRAQLSRLEGRPQVVSKVERRWLMPYADPQMPIPGPLLAASQELLRHQVAWADHRLGRLLDSLRENPRWPQAAVIATALNGNELGEHGQVLFAQNLGRHTLEVPLFVKLPIADRRSLPEPRLVSTSRLAASLLELADLPSTAAQARSLFGRSESPSASALYDHDGVNRFSTLLPSGPGSGMQLIWRSRYAEPEPEIWAAQAIEAGLGSQPILESPRRVLRRLRSAFQRTPPLSGRTPDAVELRLFRWLADGGVEAVADPLMASRMAVELRRNWLLFVGRERTPQAERRFWRIISSEDDTSRRGRHQAPP